MIKPRERTRAAAGNPTMAQVVIGWLLVMGVVAIGLGVLALTGIDSLPGWALLLVSGAAAFLTFIVIRMIARRAFSSTGSL